MTICIADISKIIPFLASNFNPYNFKRMKITLDIYKVSKPLNIRNDLNLDEYLNILPKNILINGDFVSDDI